MEEEEDMTPFWLQPNSQSNRRRNLRRTSSSLLLSSGVMLIILLVIAAAFVFIIIPSFLSFTSQIFRPHLVKKSWDTLNFVLVLFAIVCGFLSRNNNDQSPRSASSPSASYEEYKFGDRSSPPSAQDRVQKPNFGRTHYRSWSNNGSLNRLRSFSSHPDLRQEEASWLRSESYDPWRFYDDTHLYNYRSSSSNDQAFHQWRPQQKLQAEQQEAEKEQKEEQDGVKNIGVDTSSVIESQKEVVYTPPEESPLPPPPQPKVVKRKVVRRTYQDVAKKGGESTRKFNDAEVIKSPSSPPPPPPTPPPQPPLQFEESSYKNEKKRGTTSATKEFLTSLRRNKKKKKQRQKSVENLDSFFNYESSYTFPSIEPPPPPPPPPPPLFQNLFSPRKRKAKKIDAVPPPPPPPPPQKTQLYSSSASKSKLVSENIHSTSTTHKPPLPVKIKSYNNAEETLSSGTESPLMGTIPPPPPLPPFKMPMWKFEVVQGDFVRLKSNNETDFEDDAESSSSSPLHGADSTMSPLFCPSPDVDTKADNFIARFRAGLRLEKMNSVKERGRSNLGPEPGPSQDSERGGGGPS